MEPPKCETKVVLQVGQFARAFKLVQKRTSRKDLDFPKTFLRMKLGENGELVSLRVVLRPFASRRVGAAMSSSEGARFLFYHLAVCLSVYRCGAAGSSVWSRGSTPKFPATHRGAGRRLHPEEPRLHGGARLLLRRMRHGGLVSAPFMSHCTRREKTKRRKAWIFGGWLDKRGGSVPPPPLPSLLHHAF